MPPKNRYIQIIEHIFLERYRDGDREVVFRREDIRGAADQLGIELPKNLGDVLYSFRYRVSLPESVKEKAPPGEEWVILPGGRARYVFVATASAGINPSSSLAETKVPDATPGLISKYALSDEQAVLAKIRYNRLLDIFTGVACYSLQSHLRTYIPDLGQIETDEVYVGVDRRGAHYVFPIQAKGARDTQSVVQVAQDFAMCEAKFPTLIRRPIAAKAMSEDLIAMFELQRQNSEIRIGVEKHYRLVPSDQVSPDDLASYRALAP